MRAYTAGKASKTPDGWFQPPAQGLATRRPALRSKVNHRGQTPNTIANRPMVFESGLERKVASTVIARRDVLDLWDQPPSVRYRDEDGVMRRTTADYLATLVDGRRILIFVKPAERAERHDLEGFLKRLAPQVPRAFATDVVAMTEKDVPRDAVARAALINAVRRTPKHPVDGLVEAMVAALHGAVPIGDLVARTGQMGGGGRAFRAVVRQIDAGALRIVHGAAIDHRTVVAPSVVRGPAQARAAKGGVA